MSTDKNILFETKTNEYYSYSANATKGRLFYNRILMVYGEVTCIKPNNISHVDFAKISANDMPSGLIFNSAILMFSNYGQTYSSQVTVKLSYNTLAAAFGKAGDTYHFGLNSVF